MNAVLLPIAKLKKSKNNPRKDCSKDLILELADSIKQQGILQPLIVRQVEEDEYEIIAGHRRFMAAEVLNMTDVPVIVKDVNDEDAEIIRMIENVQREDVHPLEEAEAYEELMKKHNYKTVEEVAAKSGKSNSYIYQRMKLCDLDPACRKMFYENKLTLSIALLVARIPIAMQLDAAEAIIDEKRIGGAMSYRKAKEYIQDNYMLQLKTASFDVKADDLIPDAGKCSECPKQTGNQADLFADITNSADVCTDPSCFKRKEEATRKLKQRKEKKEAENWSVSTSNDEHPGNDKKALALKNKKEKEITRQRDEIGKETASKALEELIEKVLKNTINFWPFLLRYQFNKSTISGLESMSKKLGLKGSVALKKLIDMIPKEEQPGLFFRFLIDGNDDAYDLGDYSDELKELCKLYGIDLKLLEKQVKDNLKHKFKEEKKAVKQPAKSTNVKSVSVKKNSDSMEFKGADGAKVIVTSKTKLTEEEKKAAQEGLSKLAGIFCKKNAKEVK
jgi:ParB/RepB/Spo0J family partition protein